MKTNRMCSRALTWTRSSHGKWGTVVKTAPVCQGMLQTMTTLATSQSVSQAWLLLWNLSATIPGADDEPLLPERERRTNKLTGLCRVQRKLHSPKSWRLSPLPKKPFPISVQREKCLEEVPISIPKGMLSSRSVPVTLLNLLPTPNFSSS